MRTFHGAVLAAGAMLAISSGFAASQTPGTMGGAREPQAQAFTPPPRDAMPAGKLGAEIKLGEQIFRHTTIYARGTIGNAQNCSNCHLDAGRLAGSAPMWAAYGAYPAYRSKNGKVNNFGMRLQGCFRYSENGKVPALDSKLIVALESYSYWLSTGAPTGVPLIGRGYPKLPPPSKPSSYTAGEAIYKANCSLCHGADGGGQYVRGQTVFPPLWGPNSFNWGAGMASVKNAAEFIHANMPLGNPSVLSVQQAWDVATYIDSQERPQDPRFTGSVAQTRKQFHNNEFSLYGKMVNGHLLGSPP